MTEKPDALDVTSFDHVSHGSMESRTARRRSAPALSRGSFPLPHLGDWMQEGQPRSHSHEAMASRVAVSQSRARA